MPECSATKKAQASLDCISSHLGRASPNYSQIGGVRWQSIWHLCPLSSYRSRHGQGHVTVITPYTATSPAPAPARRRGAATLSSSGVRRCTTHYRQSTTHEWRSTVQERQATARERQSTAQQIVSARLCVSASRPSKTIASPDHRQTIAGVWTIGRRSRDHRRPSETILLAPPDGR